MSTKQFDKVTDVLGVATLDQFAGFISAEESADYFAEAQRRSVVQQLVRKVPLGISGQSITQVTGSGPQADWVDEARRKPLTTGYNVGLKTLRPHKLAAIVVMSAEVVRKDPAGYVSRLKSDIGEAFAKSFDFAALYGLGADGVTVRRPFGHAIADTDKSADITGGNLWSTVNNDVLLPLLRENRQLTGWAFDNVFEAVANAEVDLNGRPMFADPLFSTTSVSTGKLLNRPVAMIPELAQQVGDESILGIAGDWRKAVWGSVGGLSYEVSTEASVTIRNENGNDELISLWEHNLVGVLAESEYSFLLNDASGADFVKLTGSVL